MESHQEGTEGDENSEPVCMHHSKVVEELKQILCPQKCERPFQLERVLLFPSPPLPSSSLHPFSFLSFFPDLGLEEAVQG